MKHIAYADRKKDVSAAISFLLSDNEKFICYRAEPGYGITAFFHRMCYLLQSTENIICLYCELSDNVRSPLHEACKKIIIKNGILYQSLQMYADECYGEYSQTLLDSMVQDLPALGNTLANLLDHPKTFPIYSGYYPDLIKQLFFELVKRELANKTVILFVDNVQNIDNSSMYDIVALAELNNVKVIMSQTGNSSLLEKLLLELEIKSSLRYVDFSEPSIECVQELWKNQSRSISNSNAQLLIQQTQGNIRQIIHAALYGKMPDMHGHTMIGNEILTFIYILQGPIRLNDILVMLNDSPTCSFIDCSVVKQTISGLVQNGFLSCVLHFDGEEVYYARIRVDNQRFWNSLILNDADALIYQDIIFRYLSAKKNHTIDELVKLYELADIVAPRRKAYWGRELLIESLKLGYPISIEWIDTVRTLSEPETQFLCAICLYKKWKYKEALAVITKIWPQIQGSRDARILYGFILNRCRQHQDADAIIWDLFSTSSDINEKAVLLSIAVSNCIHAGNENKARKIVEDYSASINSSSQYGYFLRNSATLYQGHSAEEKWKDALKSFQQFNDEYGELTTYANMARIYIRKGNVCCARTCLERAYNGLMSYGMEQLHIVSNNLAVAYLYCGDIPNAKKHLRIAKVIAKSIMPQTYVTINECCIMLEAECPEQALENLLKLKNDVDASNLHRLKGRYYLALAGLYCLQGDFSNTLSVLAYSETFISSFFQLRERIRKCCLEKIAPPIINYRHYFTPAYLEYWIANPLSIMSGNSLTPKTLV